MKSLLSTIPCAVRNPAAAQETPRFTPQQERALSEADLDQVVGSGGAAGGVVNRLGGAEIPS